MCGLAGALERNVTVDRWLRLLQDMGDTLVHRGPDDAGVWYSAEEGVGLSFRRLSILDLSPAGHQPMVSASGRHVLAFNGEIYNYRALAAELEREGCRFRSGTDTEVMLAAIERWGLEAALSRFIGMFAFALWDRAARRLYLVRDRLGIKPMYYGRAGDALVFGSELKALRVHPGLTGTVDRGALTLFMRHQYVPEPYTIYEGVRKLPPGCLLEVGPERPAEPVVRRYWSLADAVQRGRRRRFAGTEREAVDRLEALLSDAVRLRMIADVPLGAFLSGGIDSSTVVALMQSHSTRPVRTFTIGFHESGYDEAPFARAVAEHLGTDHTELYVTEREAMEVIPGLPAAYDEPFGDSSQIPTLLLSELTRRHVTVSLSGDGGDEMFGGYLRYRLAMDLWRKLCWMPGLVRRRVGATIQAVPVQSMNRYLAWLAPALGPYGRAGPIGDKLRKLSEVLAADGFLPLYQRVVSHWKDPASLVIGGHEPPTPFGRSEDLPAFSDVLELMMYLDATTYLPEDILTKVDRASMRHSLEVRVPVLDHRVVEFCWRLPTGVKVRNGDPKWPLKQILGRYVPATMFERRKTGFGVPIGTWLRGPLAGWAEDLLAEDRLRREGFLEPAPVRERWEQHLSGARNWEYYLWDVLVFQAWLEQQRA